MKLTIKDFRILENNDFVKELNETQLENLKKKLELLKKSEDLSEDFLENRKVYTNPEFYEIIVGNTAFFVEKSKQIFLEYNPIESYVMNYIDGEVFQKEGSYEYVRNFVEFDVTLTPENE